MKGHSLCVDSALCGPVFTFHFHEKDLFKSEQNLYMEIVDNYPESHWSSKQ